MKLTTELYCETKEIIEAIRPFFTKEMWSKFVSHAPTGYRKYKYYLAEWYRIAAEFEIEVTA